MLYYGRFNHAVAGGAQNKITHNIKSTALVKGEAECAHTCSCKRLKPNSS